jgi:hypothetical protein
VKNRFICSQPIEPLKKSVFALPGVCLEGVSFITSSASVSSLSGNSRPSQRSGTREIPFRSDWLRPSGWGAAKLVLIARRFRLLSFRTFFAWRGSPDPAVRRFRTATNRRGQTANRWGAKGCQDPKRFFFHQWARNRFPDTLSAYIPRDETRKGDVDPSTKNSRFCAWTLLTIGPWSKPHVSDRRKVENQGGSYLTGDFAQA